MAGPYGLDDEQMRTMDGDGNVRYYDPPGEPVTFIGTHPLRNDPTISVIEANEVPEPDRRPWYRKAGG